MKVLVAGATGFVGKALVKRLLDEEHEVFVLSRRSDAFKNLPSASLKVQTWDGQNVGHWSKLLEDVDVVVNLAGEGIADQPWSTEQKRKIKASRLDATRTLVNATARSLSRPRVWVNASAVGYYGNVPEGDVTEDSPKGKGFLPDVCADWEEQALNAADLGLRVVLLRFGIVLEKDGGALKKFILPFKWYAGGPLGSGKQWFPWVHRDDVVGAILFAIEHERLSGPVNVTAPEPLRMKEFCQELGRAMKRPSWAPVPGFVLKLVLGELSEMLLTGQRVIPQRLTQAGYSFKYPQASLALASLFTSPS